MNEVLLDSDILIDHLRGYEPARRYLQRFEAGEAQGYLSVMSVAGLATGQMRQEGKEGVGVKFGANMAFAWQMP